MESDSINESQRRSESEEHKVTSKCESFFNDSDCANQDNACSRLNEHNGEAPASYLKKKTRAEYQKEYRRRLKEKNTSTQTQKSNEQRKRKAANSKAYRERKKQIKEEEVSIQTQEFDEESARSKANIERKKRLTEEELLMLIEKSDVQKQKSAVQLKACRNRLKLKKTDQTNCLTNIKVRTSAYGESNSLTNKKTGNNILRNKASYDGDQNIHVSGIYCQTNEEKSPYLVANQPLLFIKEEQPSTSGSLLLEPSMDIKETIVIKREEEEEAVPFLSQDKYENNLEDDKYLTDNRIKEEPRYSSSDDTDEEDFNDTDNDDEVIVKDEPQSPCSEDDRQFNNYSENQKVNRAIQANMRPKMRTVSIQTSSIACDCTLISKEK